MYGMNLVELQLAVAIVAVLGVILALAVYGVSWNALKLIVGVPLVILGVVAVISVVAYGVLGTMYWLTARRVRRAMAMLRAGSPEATAAVELATGWGLKECVSKHQDEIVGLLSMPTPARAAALRLLIQSCDRHHVEADDAFVAGAHDWPDDLLPVVLELVRSAPAKLALVPVFLERAAPATRRTLLERLFSRYAQPAPAREEPWLRMLAPYEADIRSLRGFGIDDERVAAFTAAFDKDRSAS